MQVSKFNALPRKPKSPSGLVSNNWHFDLRFIYLDPPSHVLFLVQPESTYIHIERLPLGASNGIAFFPESGAEAAPEIARALMQAFLDSLVNHKLERNPPPPYAPWSLSTDDRELAAAVGKEFKRIGVREELCNIQVSNAHLKVADRAFMGFWLSMIQSLDIPTRVIPTMSPPEGISFSIFKPAPWGEDRVSDELEQGVKYAQVYHQVGIDARHVPNSQVSTQIMEQAQAAMELLASKTIEQVQKEADAGNDSAALDYAVRIRCNLGVVPNRSLHYYYLMKVIQSSSASKDLKSRAHGLLVDWFTSSSTVSLFARYMFGAAFHANQSVILAGDASPQVLWFGYRIVEPQAEKATALRALYKPLWLALEKRHQEVSEKQEKAEKKREKNSNRYVCAAPACYIQASKGGGLRSCAGSCDLDVKPAYCSKDVQDWKNHKPFCKPGASCSILTKEHDLPAVGQGQSEEVLTIPVAGPNGRPMMLSTSTMTPEMLKMFQAMSVGETPEGSNKTLDELLSKSSKIKEVDVLEHFSS
ncbi:hypothetical protein R3P38DRAFT_2953748 [Favolaschia claudopus]|uniref:MYND-type domain-containing protein n=1 Tax=Favolaschia claudopus TaxID=2862362 RepID=A0AAW0BH31_9AGAR